MGFGNFLFAHAALLEVFRIRSGLGLSILWPLFTIEFHMPRKISTSLHLMAIGAHLRKNWNSFLAMNSLHMPPIILRSNANMALRAGLLLHYFRIHDRYYNLIWNLLKSFESWKKARVLNLYNDLFYLRSMSSFPWDFWATHSSDDVWSVFMISIFKVRFFLFFIFFSLLTIIWFSSFIYKPSGMEKIKISFFQHSPQSDQMAAWYSRSLLHLTLTFI